MDFSKIKKIFYILCIVSILISIKSRVFAAATYDVSESYMYDVYESRCASFVLKFDRMASQQQKEDVANYYTSGNYYPFLTVRNSNASDYASYWNGASDYTQLCHTYNYFALYLIRYDGTTYSSWGTGYMSFPTSQVYKYQSNSCYRIDLSLAGGGPGIFTRDTEFIVCSANLYGYHSSILDDYFVAIHNGSSADITTALNNANNKLTEINESLTNTTPNAQTDSTIQSVTSQDNSTGADNINTNFFSNLTSSLANISSYNLYGDNIIEIPLPHSQKKITFNANMLYNKLPDALIGLITSFWYFVFGMYAFKFVNKIYISAKSGDILNGFTNNNEVITNDML